MVLMKNNRVSSISGSGWLGDRRLELIKAPSKHIKAQNAGNFKALISKAELVGAPSLTLFDKLKFA